MKRILSLLSASLLILGGTVSLFPVQSASADAFNQNQITADAIFDNPNTMSPSQIDAFLNTFPNSCISPNSGFRTIDPNGYNPTNGYLYGSFVTAGQAIYDAGQAYGINPQVLITTLEKEQSLVTGRNNFSGYCNNGDQHKYAAAVGYGCPDSGTTYSYTGLNLYQRNGVTVTDTGTTCVNSSLKAGFSQQVIRAAWLFKFGEQRSEGNIHWAVIKGSWDNSDDPQSCYGGPMTQGTWQRCPSGSSSFYDGYTTIDGTAVHMDSGSTASLYWYTPHFHGNQLFYDTFTSWFGNPSLVCTSADTPGSLVQSLYNPKTYQHFYTAYSCEANIASYLAGYQREGASFNTTSQSLAGAVPVYRLYNPSTTVHFWTTSQAEINTDSQHGYQVEGVTFYSLPPTGSGMTAYPVYRLYNPRTYQHIWSLSQGDTSTQQAGYQLEGVAFYSQ